jgi:hypothetical protein
VARTLTCVESGCHRKIDPAHQFCPYCGADNRPPCDRDPIEFCPHEYVVDGPYCYQCGFARYGLVKGSFKVQRRVGILLIALAVFAGLAAIDLSMATQGKDVPLGTWIRTWADDEYQERDRDSYTTYKTTKGRQAMSYLAWGAGALMFTGVGLLFVKPRSRAESK